MLGVFCSTYMESSPCKYGVGVLQTALQTTTHTVTVGVHYSKGTLV